MMGVAARFVCLVGMFATIGGTGWSASGHDLARATQENVVRITAEWKNGAIHNGFGIIVGERDGVGLDAEELAPDLIEAVRDVGELEWRLAGESAPLTGYEADAPPATSEELEYFYTHLEQVLMEIGFLNVNNPRTLMRRLRRLFVRAHPDKNEVNILRGILTAVERTGARDD